MDPFNHNSKRKIENLVVDSGGFIKHTDLQNLAEKIYTIHEVVAEIKDKATKERLAVLPFELHFRDPDVSFIKQITEFSKKTGDYPCLSATDIKVMALTLMLEKEAVGNLDHIRDEPKRSKTIVHHVKPSETPASKLPGFFEPSNDTETIDDLSSHITSLALSDNASPSLQPASECLKEPLEEHSESGLDTSHEDFPNEAVSDEDVVEESEDDSDQSSPTQVDPKTEQPSEKQEQINESDDDEGWITPQNVKQAYRQMGIRQDAPQTRFKVACITTDFSMQNVMMQMGLHVLSADGMLIKSLRTYVLRCYGCFKVTHRMDKKFCPSCGNQTLKRVAVSTDKNGNQKYHISTRRPINVRGTKYSLPAPQGGKHALNPILVEDQPRPDFRASKKSLQKLDVFDPDYVARDSPFLTYDLNSRAALLGRSGKAEQRSCYWMYRNPNAVKKPKK